MYEPVSQRWQTQRTTGDIPPISENQCVVGIQGDDNTYEVGPNSLPFQDSLTSGQIFIYGGQLNGDVQKTVENGAVWVLSLPSFSWHKQSNPLAVGRYMHSCNIAGKSQMISVGGVAFLPDTPDSGFNTAGGTTDPWDQGLGVLDMSTLQWKSSYDPSADDYTTPQIVKDYIKRNGQYPAWRSSTLRRWFVDQGTCQELVY